MKSYSVTIQMKAIEQYFNSLWYCLLSYTGWFQFLSQRMKSWSVNIQMEAATGTARGVGWGCFSPPFFGGIKKIIMIKLENLLVSDSFQG